jgi:hypothetical protein
MYTETEQAKTGKIKDSRMLCARSPGNVHILLVFANLHIVYCAQNYM